MKLKKLIMVIALSVVMTVSAVGAATNIEKATPTDSSVFVDGQKIEFDAYNINNNNYFKLRDIAFILRGTNAQFDVGYDQTTDSIYISTGKPYTIVGGEMQKGDDNMEEASSTESNIIKDGTEIDVTAYNINDNNYLKLRELGEELGFDVSYDETTNSVSIDTTSVQETEGYSNSTEKTPIDIDSIPSIYTKPISTPIPGAHHR